MGQMPIGSAGKQCRSLEQLCEADAGFTFDLNPDGDVSSSRLSALIISSYAILSLLPVFPSRPC
jgi:hypothetical protein